MWKRRRRSRKKLPKGKVRVQRKRGTRVTAPLALVQVPVALEPSSSHEPAHCAAREMYGLKHPSLPSPYAQESTLVAVGSAFQMVMEVAQVPLVAIGSVTANMLYQVGPSGLLAGLATYKGSKMVNEVADEMTAAAYVLIVC